MEQKLTDREWEIAVLVADDATHGRLRWRPGSPREHLHQAGHPLEGRTDELGERPDGDVAEARRRLRDTIKIVLRGSRSTSQNLHYGNSAQPGY